MNELSSALEKIEAKHSMPEEELHPLLAASQRWAEHSLSTYQGELLQCSLMISAALADFTSKLSVVNPAVYADDCGNCYPEEE